MAQSYLHTTFMTTLMMWHKFYLLEDFTSTYNISLKSESVVITKQVRNKDTVFTHISTVDNGETLHLKNEISV